MIYYSENNRYVATHIADVPREVKRLWKSPIELVDYYFYLDGELIWTIGYMKNGESVCAVDYYSSLSNFKLSFELLMRSLNRFDNVYAIPNSSGELIWNALNFHACELYLRPGLRLSAFKFCYKNHRYFYLNILFKLSTKGLFKLKKRIFYRGELPKEIVLDTF